MRQSFVSRQLKEVRAFPVITWAMWGTPAHNVAYWRGEYSLALMYPRTSNADAQQVENDLCTLYQNDKLPWEL